MTRIFTKSLLKACVLGSSLGLAAGLGGCGEGRDKAKDEVVTQHVAIVRANYDAAIAGAKKLRSAVSDLVKEPSQDTLDAARQAWIESRPAYLQSESYRFYEGPIDNAETGREGRINAWPLDESYIDYVRNPMAGGAPIRTGIINNRKAFPEITKQVLIAQNEKDGEPEENISTGYHAIEFLLWGQDTSDTGPGNRPFTDYVAGQAAGDPDADRRRQYIGLAADLLVEDLEYTRAQWNDGEPWLKQFLANVDNQSLQHIVTGIQYLTKNELASERIQPAYESMDQEDEHSCFSDTTDQDMKFDLVGIGNVYFGRYGDDDGKGLEDLVRPANAQLDARIKAQFRAAESAIADIPKPFDQAIKNAPRKLKSAIDALDDLNDSLASLPDALNL